MSISNISPINTYLGDGTTKTFIFDFKIFKTTNLTVDVDNVIVSNYSVVKNPVGGNITFTTAPPNNSVVRLRRNTPVERLSDYTQGGSLSSNTLDLDFDVLVAMIQDFDFNSLTYKSGTLDFDAVNNNIINLAEPINPQDAATKNYVDSQVFSWGEIAGSLSNQSDLHNLLLTKSDNGHNHNTLYEPIDPQIQIHINSTSNPHGITASTIGLGNVQNVADLDKPISTATQAALNLKADATHNHTGQYELAFSKNSAFNKSFGNLINTVCQGNDSRLSNARTPTPHTHTKSEITNFGISDQLLGQLSNVNLTGPVNGQVLQFNGSAWVNTSLNISNITNLQNTLNLKMDYLDKQVDQISATLVYKGYAIIGSSTTEAKWKITKYEKVDNNWITTNPNGLNTYTFVWNNRLSYTYS